MMYDRALYETEDGMKGIRLAVILGLIIGLMAAGSAQDGSEIDPETMKLVEKYREQNASMPKEVSALLPGYLTATDSTWMVEETSKILLQGTLQADNENATIDGKNVNGVNYKIIVNVFNMKSSAGKMTANSTLNGLRKRGREEWAGQHKAENNGPDTSYAPDKIAVQKGYILIQKKFSAAHDDGEGTVPAETTYCGYLYMEVDNGLLTAEIGELKDKTAVEKILKHTAAAATKIRWESYFK